MNTVETLVDLIENSEAGRYLLESGLENQWDFCAQYLQVDENLLIDRRTAIEEDKIVKLTVNENRNIN